MRLHLDPERDLNDQGLAIDLRNIMRRRRFLTMLGGAAAIGIVGCGDDDPKPAGQATDVPSGPTNASSATTAASTQATAAAATRTQVTPIPTQATPASACAGPLPQETLGPFPANGANGPNVLTQSGIVRTDIRSSIGTSKTVAGGVPLTLTMTVVDTKDGCKPLAGAAVYAWHCDREGRYSVYDASIPNENYLRGVQAAGADGVVTFKTIFPGCYAGRWPHVHFEVYPTLQAASTSRNARATSQLALPKDACEAAYGSAGYEPSVRNLARLSIERDGVFADGWQQQMAAVTGSAASGYVATLVVGV
ncbi:MAG: intradiol ring-cleavage dioxygenase [Dehalococcoidia bacterium]